MSVFDSIRSFLGLPPRNEGSWREPQFKNPIIGEEEYDDDDEFDELNDFRLPPNQRNGMFGFNIFSGNMLEIHRYFEQQFDEMVKSFHDSNWFSPGFGDGAFDMPSGRYLEPPNGDAEAKVDSNPRERFLKPSYTRPPQAGVPADSDIDDKISTRNVLDLFPDKGSGERQAPRNELVPREPSFPSPPASRSSFSFSSQVVTKKILPNGGIEEERKITSNGKEETIVKRQLGDQVYQVTTTRLSDGTIQTNEELVNLDQNDLENFNKAWASGVPPSGHFPVTPEHHSPLLDILKQLF